MASGVVHNTVTVAASAMLVPTVMAYGFPMGTAVAVGAGCLAGIFLTPDLDQETYNRIENKFRKSKNPFVAILGNLYIIFWMPYALAVSHRSFVSHAPIVGTLIRVIYLIAGTALVLFLSGHVLSFVSPSVATAFLGWLAVTGYLGSAVVGLVIADTLHWIFDMRWLKWVSKIAGVK